MSSMESLHDLFMYELKNLYGAEKQILKALPKMAKAATNSDLQKGIQKHVQTTQAQVERLEKIYNELDAAPKGRKCKIMEALIEEAKDILNEDVEPEVLDAALAAGAQKIEHQEIAAYGSARSHAETLGFSKIAEILQKSLDEEKQMDEALNLLADEHLNPDAAALDQAAEEEDSEEMEPANARAQGR